MMYEKVSSNIIDILRETNCITERQMCVFFEDVLEPINTQLLLGEMIAAGIIMKHETLDAYVYRFGGLKKEEFLKADIEAFWPIALWGSEQVRFITTGTYPSQYFIVSEDERFYDFTVLDNTKLATMAEINFRNREYKKEKNLSGVVQKIPENETGPNREQVSHIAVVKYENRIRTILDDYGAIFKTVCLVNDADADVRYFIKKNGRIVEA